MNRKYQRTLNILFIPLVVFIILACNIGGASTEISPTTPATEEQQQLDTANTPTDVPVLITVTEQLQLTSTPESGNQIVPVPVSFPELRSGNAGDFDSSVAFENKTTVGGDRFTFDKFERPFNAESMDTYFPYLDIVNTFVYQDDTWIYARIVLHGPDANNQFPGRYAAELDFDVDGKGDWLVIASAPSSKDWTTTGVQVYQDADRSVGDMTPAMTDAKAEKGNGFETLVFDQGKGNDVETAWVRLAPDAENTIEISVKRSVVGASSPAARYLIGMWAGNQILDPTLFDLNDTFTHEQAGAADKGFTNFYPIKAVAEIDNSCRMAVGFQPTGTEPGICDQPSKPKEQGGTGGPSVNVCIVVACGAEYTWNPASCSCVFSGPR